MTVFKFLPHAQTVFTGPSPACGPGVLAYYSYNKKARNMTRTLAHPQLGEVSKATAFISYEQLQELLVLSEEQTDAAAQVFAKAPGYRPESVHDLDIPGNSAAVVAFFSCVSRIGAKGQKLKYRSGERDAVRIVSEHCGMTRMPADVRELQVLKLIFEAFGRIDLVALAPGSGEWGTSVRYLARRTREYHDEKHPALSPALELRAKGTPGKLRAWFAANDVYAVGAL